MKRIFALLVLVVSGLAESSSVSIKGGISDGYTTPRGEVEQAPLGEQ